MPGIEGQRDTTTRMWSNLLAAYRQQSTISHLRAGKLCGCERHRAGKLYHNGAPKFDLVPIKVALAEEKAIARADRARAERDMSRASLTDAQDDARNVALLEGQMIAAMRRGTVVVVQRIYKMLEALDPVAEQIAADIAAMADDPKVAPADRRAVLRDVMAYQKQAGDLVEQIMALERQYLNEPTAILGAELDLDVADLTRRALESAKALQLSATLIDVTPDSGAMKH